MRAALAATLIAALGATALGGCATKVDPVITAGTTAGSSVKIELPNGIGSGVYIGNGIIITAAHVVEGAKSFRIKSDAGDVQNGTVLWVNAEYDIAAVRPANARRFAAANLSCRTPAIGEEISAWGNPVGIESITMHGYVSGTEREAAPNWKVVFPTDMTTIAGMSGGPTYDAHGYVVGITVGAPNFGGPDAGLGMVVPGSVVCMLLGRV